jgi:hypothetical protein
MSSGHLRRRETKAARRKKLLAERCKFTLLPSSEVEDAAIAELLTAEADDHLEAPYPYDADAAPDPAAWLALDEDERMLSVQLYHRRAGIPVPNESAHAAAHAVVENQLAAGDPAAVPRAIERLRAGGLDRHDAVHAIAAILMTFVNDLPRGALAADDTYEAAVERLTIYIKGT